VLPILDISMLGSAQLDDLRRVLKQRKIPYFLSSEPIQGRVLFVRERDVSRGRQAVREEFESFALIQREKWEREWRETCQGSYWKWLFRRSVGRASMVGLSALWFFGG
jgi:hypothetical protein